MQNATSLFPPACDIPSAKPVERLPFTVRIVEGDAMLHKALQLRQSAYARHVPELARQLGEPEAMDDNPGAVVLIAESKLDGAPLGTMRVQTNRFDPLWLEQSVTLPDHLQGRALAEATRLGITGGLGGRVAKAALFKAYFNYCFDTGVDAMVIAGRAPLDRQYDALLFDDVFPGRGFIPMRHAGNIPHRVLALEVAQVAPRWKVGPHPMYGFIFATHHPDIMVGREWDAVTRPRHNASEETEELRMHG